MKYEFLGRRARERGRITIYETEKDGHRRQFISDEHAVYAVDDKAEADEVFDLFGIGDERKDIPVTRRPIRDNLALLPSTEYDKPASLIDFTLFHMATKTQLCLFTSEYGLIAVEAVLLTPFIGDNVTFLARSSPNTLDVWLVAKAGDILEGVITPVDNSFLLQAPVRRLVNTLNRATADQLAANSATLLKSAATKPDPCVACKAAHPHCDKCCKTCDDQCNASQECRKG